MTDADRELLERAEAAAANAYAPYSEFHVGAAVRTRDGRIFEGDDKWKSMPAPTGTLFDWDSTSTYVREPPYFVEFGAAPAPSVT